MTSRPWSPPFFSTLLVLAGEGREATVFSGGDSPCSHFSTSFFAAKKPLRPLPHIPSPGLPFSWVALAAAGAFTLNLKLPPLLY